MIDYLLDFGVSSSTDVSRPARRWAVDTAGASSGCLINVDVRKTLRMKHTVAGHHDAPADDPPGDRIVSASVLLLQRVLWLRRQVLCWRRQRFLASPHASGERWDRRDGMVFVLRAMRIFSRLVCTANQSKIVSSRE